MTQQIGLMSTMAVVTAIAAWAVVPVAGQGAAKPATKAAATTFTTAKTPWGDPDLQGIYTNKDENGIPFEKPSQFEGKKIEDVDDSAFAQIVRARNEASVTRAPGIGGAETGAGPVHWYEHYDAKNSRAWLVTDPADGKVPPRTDEARQRASAAAIRRRGGNGFDVGPFDGPEDLSLYDQCITRGLPGSMMPAIYGNSYQLHQSPGFVAIRYEMIHETRVIPLDDRPHVGSKLRTYMGDARGHWEGHTLVVETTNFRSPDRDASEKLKLIEHFTPVAPNKVEWSVTYDDPSTWTRPWTFVMILTKDPTQAPFEYACHEGNYGLRNILSAARAEEKR